MQRILIVGLIGAALWFGYVFVASSLQSDEDRVRIVLEDIVDAFNARKPKRILEHLDASWREESSRLDREKLRTLLRAMALRSGALAGANPKGRRAFLESGIEVDVDGETAIAVFEAGVRARAGRDARELWRAAFTCEFKRIDGDWLMVRSRHETISGRRPF